MFNDADFKITKQSHGSINHKIAIKKLPYIFRDPVEFDKKVDPRKLPFGSRINHESKKRETYYPVRDVLSPARLIIGEGLPIRLLGVREKKETRDAAVEFLKNKTRGQRVFMKFDVVKHDHDKNLLCYLYLQNKTFLNAHMIKRGLVEVDTSFDYKLKDKFLASKEKN